MLKNISNFLNQEREMVSYKLSNKAVKDLSSIWDYTFETWSEIQADKYYNELIENCEELAKNQSLGRIYAEIDSGILGCKVGSHIIFYRIKSISKIEIIRFLHSKMDLKIRIKH